MEHKSVGNKPYREIDLLDGTKEQIISDSKIKNIS
jgi:hypothetical protein